MSRRLLAFCILAVLVEQSFCAPLTKTDRVTPGTEDATVGSETEDNVSKGIDDEHGAANYLKRFGYSNPGISKNSRDYKDELKESIKRMQKFFKLNVTGELDNDTLEIMNSPRCSLPDIVPGAETGRQKRFTHFASWPTKPLTYKISNYPTYTNGFSSKEDIDATIDKGLKIWTQYGNVYISKSESSSSNLKLGFYRGDHGDGDSFDGRGGTLAHAFFPTNGNLHYDDDETWSKTDKGYNLELVTTHEGGHLLGLGHSNDLQSVMYPNYKYQTNFKLGDDDIKGIQYLYGSKSGLPPMAATTTTIPRPWWKKFNFFRGG